MPSTLRVLTFAACFLAAACHAGQPAKPEAPPGVLAKVVAAGYLGGEGAEWLCAGGFAPDGKLVLAGVSLDPEVTLAGVKAEVLGEDAPPPPALPRLVPLKPLPPPKTSAPAPPPKPPNVADEELKKLADELTPPKKEEEVRRDGQGNVAYERLHWNRKDATGFVALAAPGLTRILSVRRFPRGVASITSAAVARDGAICLAGGATEGIAKLCADVKVLPVADNQLKSGDCGSVFVAKLTPDAAKVLWVRRMDGPSVAPRLRLMPDGDIVLMGPDVRAFDGEGNVKSSAGIARGVNGGVTVSPVDRMIAKAAEAMWGTGREPWRCPLLNIFYPDGRHRYQLCSWPGPFVGLNCFRLVADSPMRKALYDEQGNLLLIGWSHGGNSVHLQQLHDLERPWPYNGLGYLAQTSCDYVVKAEPQDYRVIAAAAWPGGKIWTVGCAADGSVAWTGEPMHLGRRTHFELTAADCNDCVVVTDPALRTYRFFVPMPACGNYVTLAGDHSVPEDWGIVSGVVDGTPLLLFLSGALEKQRTAAGEFSAPQAHPAQKAFGGGGMDGYALLLELAPWTEQLAAALAPTKPPEPPPQEPVDESTLKVQRDKPPRVAREGQVFKVEPKRYRTVMVAFHDPADRMWPSFYFGDPEGPGTFEYNTKAKPKAAFTLLCANVAQSGGEQQRRVLGELLKWHTRKTKDASGRERQENTLEPQVRFVLKGMSPWRLDEKASVRGGAKRISARPACDVSGELQVGERKVAVAKALCTASFRVESYREFRGDPNAIPNVADLSMTFVVQGKDLGLQTPEARGNIRVRITWTGTDEIVYWTPPKPLENIPDRAPGD